jgi:hypothetical protein
VTHEHAALREVDIAPHEAENLARAQAGEQHRRDRRPEPLRRRGQQRAHLLLVEEPHPRLAGAGPLAAREQVGRVGRDQPVPGGVDEHFELHPRRRGRSRQQRQQEAPIRAVR